MGEPQDDGLKTERSADFRRGYKLAETANLTPTGKPFVPRSSGWGKVTGGQIKRVRTGNHHYDIQGGFGGTPPAPPTDKPDPRGVPPAAP